MSYTSNFYLIKSYKTYIPPQDRRSVAIKMVLASLWKVVCIFFKLSKLLGKLLYTVVLSVLQNVYCKSDLCYVSSSRLSEFFPNLSNVYFYVVHDFHYIHVWHWECI